MPAKGKTKVSDRQRRKIAAGKIVGKTSRELAAETGLSESTVKKQAVDDRTKTLIARLKERDEALLEQCWLLALARLGQRLKHRRLDVVRDATRDLIRIVEAGDPPLARLEVQPSGGGSFTLEELLSTLRKFDTGARP